MFSGMMVKALSFVLLFTATSQPDDEQELRDIQLRLARAWVEKDRATIEAILAPEWSVIQADGTVQRRGHILNAVFDTKVLEIEELNVSDIEVQQFGYVAVVRGRTVARGRMNGQPGRAQIRFTDVFVRRDGRWQAVASQATALAGPTK